MKTSMPRRDFLKAVPAAAWALAETSKGAAPASQESPPPRHRFKIEPFDYQGVRLRPSRWQQQYLSAHDFYFGVSDDDILCGYRDG